MDLKLFLHETCTEEPKAFTTSARLANAYDSWMTSHGKKCDILTSNRMTRSMKELGYISKRRAVGVGIKGIELSMEVPSKHPKLTPEKSKIANVLRVTRFNQRNPRVIKTSKLNESTINASKTLVEVASKQMKIKPKILIVLRSRGHYKEVKDKAGNIDWNGTKIRLLTTYYNHKIRIAKRQLSIYEEAYKNTVNDKKIHEKLLALSIIKNCSTCHKVYDRCNDCKNIYERGITIAYHSHNFIENPGKKCKHTLENYKDVISKDKLCNTLRAREVSLEMIYRKQTECLENLQRKLTNLDS